MQLPFSDSGPARSVVAGASVGYSLPGPLVAVSPVGFPGGVYGTCLRRGVSGLRPMGRTLAVAC